MNFWNAMNTRWEGETIKGWNSLRKTAYILLPLFIYFLFHDLAEIILWMLLNSFLEGAGENVRSFLNQNGYTVNGIIGGLAVLIGVFVIRKSIKAEIAGQEKEAGIYSAEKKLTGYCLLGGFAFLTAFGLNLLFDFAGLTGRSQTYTQVVKVQYGVEFISGLILYGILSPVVEEAVFRGLIYNRMKRCFQVKIAIIFSALIFGAYHGNLVQALYGAILGVLIAYSYERYKSFAAPVIFHGVANISIYALTYHSVLKKMGKGAGIVVMLLSLVGAGALLFIIIRHTNMENTDKLSDNYAKNKEEVK
ncbi:MAG: CPBP family intramembrane metalloprotease [Lachnospiraceae bacterium]|nr:CPBP family intramembrane metalloprotease [Lachnospiraceae bacterium]